MKEKGPEPYFRYRLACALQNSYIPQFVHSLMAELDSTILAPTVHKATIYWYRHEWGANGNPHSHKLLFVGDLNKKLNEWKATLNTYFQTILSECQLIDTSDKSNEELD